MSVAGFNVHFPRVALSNEQAQAVDLLLTVLLEARPGCESTFKPEVS